MVSIHWKWSHLLLRWIETHWEWINLLGAPKKPHTLHVGNIISIGEGSHILLRTLGA